MSDFDDEVKIIHTPCGKEMEIISAWSYPSGYDNGDVINLEFRCLHCGKSIDWSNGQ